VVRAYRSSTFVLGAVVCVLGVAMVVTSIARGGGPLALGVVLGVAFVALGAARVYLAARTAPPGGRA
jgi:hypothetical protein